MLNKSINRGLVKEKCINLRISYQLGMLIDN